jgi:hypothetical protein
VIRGVLGGGQDRGPNGRTWSRPVAGPLNRMFYDHNPRRYFQAALHMLAAAYLDPRVALFPLAKEVT